MTWFSNRSLLPSTKYTQAEGRIPKTHQKTIVPPMTPKRADSQPRVSRSSLAASRNTAANAMLPRVMKTPRRPPPNCHSAENASGRAPKKSRAQLTPGLP